MIRTRFLKFYLSFSLCVSLLTAFSAQGQVATFSPGAYFFESYVPLLKNQRVALLINQTSEVNGVSLLDTLLSQHVNIVKVFVPEHGFRGAADAGAKVDNEVDSKSGLPIVSLYGKNKKPTADQLNDIDVLIYDLQDVGVRFYTYISTLEYAMEACAENDKILMVLDRPNPLGNVVDGPVLEANLKSFVGMQKIPVIYGMTPGEYAKMLKGENWINQAEHLNLIVVDMPNYTHHSYYKIPVSPSPNLRNMTAIYLYPSLCFFEGTVVSVGRGTNQPFQVWGHPAFKGKKKFSFIPQSQVGASKPLLMGQKCYGELVAIHPDSARAKTEHGLNLNWLIEAYHLYPQKEKFFNHFFEKLAGTKKLKQQIQQGLAADEIKAGWQKDLETFKKIRAEYLIYPE